MRLRSQTFESMLKQDIAWYDRKENNTGTLRKFKIPPPPPLILSNLLDDGMTERKIIQVQIIYLW